MSPEQTPSQPGSDARLAELLAGVSLATDVVAGWAPETALRIALIATTVARELRVQPATLASVYYSAVLRFLGCSSTAPELARIGSGEDQATLRALSGSNVANPLDVLSQAVRHTKGARQRLTLVAGLLADPRGAEKIARAHCELAVTLAQRLGLSAVVGVALGQLSERWDGRGAPHRLAGAALSLPARLVHLGYHVEVQRQLEGAAPARRALAKRSGRELDPAVVAAFERVAESLWPKLEQPSVYDDFLESEPLPLVRVDAERLEGIANVFAHVADVKSRFTVGHSPAVAQLACAAAHALGASAHELSSLRIAALLHDLGRCAVPNGIWDKRGPLNPMERERARSHAAHTERMLAFSPATRHLASLAAADHERLDGSGYHRAVAGSALTRSARVLAAADMYRALVEDRPHRRAFTPSAAADLLSGAARGGQLDPEAVDAVLRAAGLPPTPKPRGEGPAGLSERELEVLGLLAGGLSNKEIGARLFISAKTVQHHVTHIHAKLGVSTRAAAAVFAVEHGLKTKYALLPIGPARVDSYGCSHTHWETTMALALATKPAPSLQPHESWKLNATELAPLIASGHLRAVDVLEAHLARLEQVNPRLNALVWSCFAEAREKARAVDQARDAGKPLGPLAGVPITIKECFAYPNSVSGVGIQGAPVNALETDPYVTALEQAGAIVVGKSNVAQLLMYLETDNPVHGLTRNPWHLERSPGGSSGGQAALIASGGSPFGLGTDVGGSSRNPAAVTGIVGFKPTHGRMPDVSAGKTRFPASALASSVGLLGRTVGDVSLAFSVLSRDVGAKAPHAVASSPASGALRVAYYEDDGLFSPCPASRRAVREAAEAVRARGATVTSCAHRRWS